MQRGGPWAAALSFCAGWCCLGTAVVQPVGRVGFTHKHV